MIRTPLIPRSITLPDPDTIRAAIDETDELSRLLRRLLRLALQLHLITSEHLRTPASAGTEVRP
ncbi:MAG: hypothetical protein U0792_05220 [Gemmataceae bacterium]